MRACARVTRRFRGSAVAVSLRDRSKHSDYETGRFFHKTCQFRVIARRARAPDAAIFNETICHPGTNYGCAERNRTLKERERKRNDAANTFFVIGLSFCFALPCFATGCHASNFKIATAAMRPRNDTKTGRFYLENRRFLFYAVVFYAVSLRIVFQTFRSGNCSVFPQNPPDLSLRGGRILRPTRQSLTKRVLYCFCRIWELVSLFSPVSRLFFQKNDVS